MSGLTLFGGHNDDARHGSCTIDGSGRSVLKDLEAFDVVSVESGNGRAEQGFNVTGSQFISSDIDDIFLDDPVDHPKRAAAAVDGSGTAHADLGCGTEGSGYVLHRYTGCASFERAADVGHTVDFHFLCIDFHCSSGEETLVHFLHTGNDYVIEHAFLAVECDFHVLSDVDSLRLEADVGDFENLGFGRNAGDVEMSVDVGALAQRGAFDLDGSSDERFVVIGRDDGARCSLCLGHQAGAEADQGSQEE